MYQSVDKFRKRQANSIYNIGIGISCKLDILHNLSRNVRTDICAKRRFRSACAFAQADHNLHWAHFLKPWLQGFLHTDSKDSDQTAWMRRLIWVFVGRICQKARILTLRIEYQRHIPRNALYWIFFKHNKHKVSLVVCQSFLDYINLRFVEDCARKSKIDMIHNVRKHTFWHVIQTKTQIGFRSCANSQANLNLRWGHMSDDTFSDVATDRKQILLLVFSAKNKCRSYFSERTTKPTIRPV